MKKISFAAAFLGTILILAIMAYAQPGPEKKQNFRGKIEERLNLSDEQKSKIEALRLEHQKEMIDLKASLEKEEISIRELKLSSNFSRANYISAVENLNEIKNQIAVKRANHRMDVYELLDDKQKEVWLKMEDRMEMRRNEMGEHRMKRERNFY